ncbi:hypothetical protein GYMLUDRAFT_61041 [Collybiopsis luxurians FD-317 M1]|uniref:Secreted protein n=1 Tax=Collybiopsis luxurians FD-317 M1 TaxID=944289 RepID=A0A0D0B3Y1_9AGAR|nr:hypothetical protein GYMLUDRAFT_61041 [Collybiopsis luxurians FD-317 M1]
MLIFKVPLAAIFYLCFWSGKELEHCAALTVPHTSTSASTVTMSAGLGGISEFGQRLMFEQQDDFDSDQSATSASTYRPLDEADDSYGNEALDFEGFYPQCGGRNCGD